MSTRERLTGEEGILTMEKLRSVISTMNQEALPRRIEIGLLLAVSILALVLRLLYVTYDGSWNHPPEYDGIEYDMLANNLLSGRGYSLQEGHPYGFRPPGYPFFLALLYAVFGRSYVAVRLANVLLGTLTCLPIYRFAKHVWQWRMGLLASLGVAVHPLLIYFTSMIYPECLILCLTAVVFLLVNEASESRRIRDVLPIGLVLSILVYLRPSMLTFGLMLCIWIWLTYETIRKRLLTCICLVVVMALAIAPWSIRNYLAFDEFIWMATEGGVTFWASNNPLATGGWVEPSPATWLGPNPPVDLRGWPELTETESEARFLNAAREWIRDHPGEFLSLLPRKLVRAWSLSFGNEARQANLPGIVPVAYAAFLSICLIGFVLSFQCWQDSLVLYLLIINSNLMALIFYGSTRQSSFVALPLIIFAALVFDRIFCIVMPALNEVYQPVTPRKTR
jgi:4-amino-4-deoxy-L-arabinose transferase-like glycosyltransferase